MTEFVNSVPDSEKKKAIRQEIGFQKLMHPLDAKERSHLYRMNYLDVELMIENLVILLDDEVEESDDGEINCLPTEEETMDLLQASDESTPTETKFTPQQPVAVIWHNQNDTLDWSVGFYLDDVEDETCRIDHLCSKDKTNWIRPSFDDIQVVKYIQILPIDVDGEWDFSARHCTFTIKNAATIHEIFKKTCI